MGGRALRARRERRAQREAGPPGAAGPGGRPRAPDPRDAALRRGFAEPEDAAAWYAGQLAAAAPPGVPLPRFDVLLLGMGAEGHVASIFPDSPAAADDRPVVAVRDCPKPPPTRVSLGFSAINSAEEVWLLVAGEGKASAVARAVAGAEPTELPAAGVHGRRATRWLLDRAAAGMLPGR
ncbi:6-phosphogluconolactonase [Blastococcus sp. PRF04-17]|uniref:6-phosphogluconolactonase n=1 Tax=Blastococcus sp. PRF04-17 TaxID=2933797 RepID=UPI002111BA1F|nr:6-phosphogluconolactonase [Blastococcus sp. PRF04-17]